MVTLSDRIAKFLMILAAVWAFFPCFVIVDLALGEFQLQGLQMPQRLW